MLCDKWEKMVFSSTLGSLAYKREPLFVFELQQGLSGLVGCLKMSIKYAPVSLDLWCDNINLKKKVGRLLETGKKQVVPALLLQFETITQTIMTMLHVRCTFVIFFQCQLVIKAL